MTTYAIATDDGNVLDAQFDIEQSSICLHSRGGTKGKDAVNSDYSAALRQIVRRLAHNGIVITGAWVDSSHVQHLPLSERAILSTDDSGLPPDDCVKLMTKRMQRVGRAPAASRTGGNPTKRIRIQLEEGLGPSSIVNALQALPTSVDTRSRDRLPVDDLNRVTPEHVWNAIQKLTNGYSDHGFGESTDFDLVTDEGVRLPPKAVFGVAATEALGFKVLPKHFSGGEGSPCFRILTLAGYTILPKSTEAAQHFTPTFVSDTAAKYWVEGKQKSVTHNERERGQGLAPAKRAQFRRLHGKLHCERCGLDPVTVYGGVHGEACIEVHHRKTQVQDMDEGHKTTLEDLECLCANCHRVVHRLLKLDGIN